jgi:type I restriction enzyme M protein
VSSVSGATEPEKFQKFVLPLILYKRLSDMLEGGHTVSAEYPGDKEANRGSLDENFVHNLKSEGTPQHFDIPHKYRWEVIRACPPYYELGYLLTEAMRVIAELNPDLRDVFDHLDYSERQGDGRKLNPRCLAELMHGLSSQHLGVKDISVHAMGDAFEYLLEKFVEAQGQDAGNFYTPKDVIMMMTHLLDAKADCAIYDPACGSGGLLVNAHKFIEQNNPDRGRNRPKLYGRERNTDIFNVAKLNMLLHGYSGARLRVGDIWHHPDFLTGDNKEPERFDFIVTNPPWNQNAYDYGAGFYHTDVWRQFPYGPPPKSSADWGWLQHIRASLNETGRAIVYWTPG